MKKKTKKILLILLWIGAIGININAVFNLSFGSWEGSSQIINVFILLTTGGYIVRHLTKGWREKIF